MNNNKQQIKNKKDKERENKIINYTICPPSPICLLDIFEQYVTFKSFMNVIHYTVKYKTRNLYLTYIFTQI